MEKTIGIFSCGINLEDLFLSFHGGESLDVLGDLSEELLGLLSKVFSAQPKVLLPIRSLMKTRLLAKPVGYLGPS